MRIASVFLVLCVLLTSTVRSHEGHDHEDSEPDHEQLFDLPSEEVTWDDSYVFPMDPSNFSDALNSNSMLLVEFYAPWCGHCKALAPIYAEAAQQLKDSVPVAKVDCDAHGEFCASHGVQGFPTIKLFTPGVTVDYNQGRSVEAIVKFAKNWIGPAAKTVVASNVTEGCEKAWTEQRTCIVGVFTEFPSPPSSEYFGMAKVLREHIDFFISKDPQVKSQFDIPADTSAPYMIVQTGKNEKPVVFTGEFTYDAVMEFAHHEAFPTIAEVNQANYPRYSLRGIPFFWAFVDGSELNPRGPTLIEFEKAAAKFKGKLSFVYLDGGVYENFKEMLGLSGTLPGLIIHDLQKNLRFMFTSSEITEASITQFVEEYLGNKLEPFVKSEPIPERNDEPVKVVVGKTFDELVMKNEKAVFVEFYASWCGHCQALAPVWEELGKHYENNPDVVIAKFNAPNNDAPISVESFPTLIYFPKTGKEENAAHYEGERDLESLIAFVEDHLSGKAQIPEELPEEPLEIPEVEVETTAGKDEL